MQTSLKKILKTLIHKAGYDIIPVKPKGLGYLRSDSVLKDVNDRKITLNQYLEDLWGMDTTVQSIMSHVDLLITPSTIVEIGAGTGLFTEKLITTLGKKNVLSYQVYETDIGWSKYLKQAHGVSVENANGYSLSNTSSKSTDIIHAHGVFVYTSFITTVSYLREIIRIASEGALIFFDVFDESCFDDPTVKAWIEAEDFYPNIIPESFLIELFSKHGFELKKTFYAPLGKGRSKYFIFSKRS